jgi:hypothetical protein
MRILLGIIFLFTSLIYANAQEQKTIVKLSGRVTAIKDTSGISYAHILNISHPYGTICDQNGNFTFSCNRGDTLQISAMGYETYLFATNTLDPRRPESNVRIRLMTKIMLLPSVTVLPFRTREGMRRFYMNMQLPSKDKEEIAMRKLKINRKEEIGGVPQRGLTLPGPVSLLYDLFGKEPKQLRKLAKFTEQDNINQQIAKRYNPEVVSLIIGKDDPNLIRNFMSYCNISLVFLSTVNDYDLYLYIKNQWNDFSRERNIK